MNIEENQKGIKTIEQIHKSNGQNTIEVEVKIPIDGLEKVFRRLQDCGFSAGPVHRETDRYFNSPHYDLREADKALRIRRVTDLETGRTWAEFNCKGPKLDQISVSRKEIEIPLEYPDRMEEILEELSFCPVECSVTKIRHYFSRGRMTAAADRVEGLGDFLELEIVEQGEEKRASCLGEIEEVMTKMGYSMEESVRSSYLTMLQKRK